MMERMTVRHALCNVCPTTNLALGIMPICPQCHGSYLEPLITFVLPSLFPHLPHPIIFVLLWVPSTVKGQNFTFQVKHTLTRKPDALLLFFLYRNVRFHILFALF